jgi:iron complex outermembrane receptor protein
VRIDLEAKPDNVRPVTLPTLEGSTPRHQLSVQSLLTVGPRLQIDPAYRYVSARAALGIPAYHTADLRVGVQLRPGMELTIVGQNLFDPRHPEWARDPGPTVEIRRSAYVRLTLRK